MKLITIILILALAIIIAFSVQATTPAQSITVDGREMIDIALEVRAPFSTATLTIQKSGFVFYVAKQRGQEEVQDSGTLTTDQMNTLAKLIEEVGFLDMENRAKGPNDPEDGSTYTVSIRILPQGPLEFAFSGNHSVSCYQFSCEHNFLKLKGKIIELWGKNVLEVGV